MSQQEWMAHLSRLNYFAGRLSQAGTHWVAAAQARELADHYERLACEHDALQAISPTIDVGAFMDMSMQPGPSGQQYGFAVYTPDAPCPDQPAPAGGKGKARERSLKPLPPPPVRSR